MCVVSLCAYVLSVCIHVCAYVCALNVRRCARVCSAHMYGVDCCVCVLGMCAYVVLCTCVLSVMCSLVPRLLPSLSHTVLMGQKKLRRSLGTRLCYACVMLACGCDTRRLILPHFMDNE